MRGREARELELKRVVNEAISRKTKCRVKLSEESEEFIVALESW
jgi:hypothetical protein